MNININTCVYVYIYVYTYISPEDMVARRHAPRWVAGAVPNSIAYFCWLFKNSRQTIISAAKIGYFLRHARVSFVDPLSLA